MRDPIRALWGVLAVLALIAGFASVALSDPRHGPAEVGDDAQCALCGMRITDRRYLSQLQTEQGEVMNFDDPGCLFRTLIERRPRVHARWFMGPSGRWIPGRDVAFAEAAHTPMGYGLAAVRRGTAGAISWDDAWRRVQRRAAGAQHHGAAR